MALPYHALTKLAPFLRGAEVLSLGYPDLMVSAEDIEKLFGYTPKKFTEAHKWHKTKPMPETFEVFEAIGAKLTIVDFTKEMGMEKIADLNHPQDLGEFDVVIDPGTLEHCFNVGQAFINAACAVKDGGLICHLSPLTMINHGFYNFCPTLFNDFYLQNHWELDEIKILPFTSFQISTTGRFDMHMEYLIRAMAKRKPESTLKYPVQTKYLMKMQKKDEVHLQN